MADNKDHDGAILVLVDDDGTVAAYMHRRLSARAANQTMCEGCGYVYNKRDPFDERMPMYESFALHSIDGFGDWLHWCQACMDRTAEAPVGHWFTGRYGNTPALDITSAPKHRLDRV